MKGKIIALLLALVLAFALPLAFAADSRIEGVEYKGFGILKLDFTRDCDWYTSAGITLRDMSGAEVPYTFIGGEEEDAYLRAEGIEGKDLTLDFTLGETSQSLDFTAVTGTEYNFRGDKVKVEIEKERCDRCGEPGHDEDYCPERIDAAALPEDAAELARIFDIDRCDRCGGMGHDDDRCPNR